DNKELQPIPKCLSTKARHVQIEYVRQGNHHKQDYRQYANDNNTKYFQRLFGLLPPRTKHVSPLRTILCLKYIKRSKGRYLSLAPLWFMAPSPFQEHASYLPGVIGLFAYSDMRYEAYSNPYKHD